mmetsp:Transcript_33837/g.46848  ORF Transcript_33837/g.46848 Transcript_33837/m.46848 type:complete len:111 (-) Transcript_33837:170-502(-)
MSVIHHVISSLNVEYRKIPTRLKVIDLFLVYQFLTAIVQVVYVSLIGTSSFNSFLSGFFSCVGSFVFTVCLRMQVNPENQEFKGISKERAYADYMVCLFLLHLSVVTFIG